MANGKLAGPGFGDKYERGKKYMYIVQYESHADHGFEDVIVSQSRSMHLSTINLRI